MFFDNLHIENPSATTDPVLVIKKEKGMKFEKVGNELGVKFGYGADKINDFNKEIEELKKYLEENPTVTTLNLFSNDIGPEGAKALAGVLKENKTLTTLNLGSNNIDSEGAKALAAALEVNKTLTTLNLSDNNIGPEEAKALAEALEVNKTLTTLDLFHNNIGPEGAKELAEALKVNKTLNMLNLETNDIGLEGAKALAEALIINTSLLDCELSSEMKDVKNFDETKSLVLKRNKLLAEIVPELEKAVLSQIRFKFNPLGKNISSSADNFTVPGQSILPLNMLKEIGKHFKGANSKQFYLSLILNDTKMKEFEDLNAEDNKTIAEIKELQMQILDNAKALGLNIDAASVPSSSSSSSSHSSSGKEEDDEYHRGGPSMQ